MHVMLVCVRRLKQAHKMQPLPILQDRSAAEWPLINGASSTTDVPVVYAQSWQFALRTSVRETHACASAHGC